MTISIDNPKLSREEMARIKARAAENARRLGLADWEWNKLRTAWHPLIGDILMDVAPELPPVPPEDRPARSARQFGRASVDRLLSELIEARRVRDAGRLRALLVELTLRRSRAAGRLYARARLALLAIEAPERLPFRI